MPSPPDLLLTKVEASQYGISQAYLDAFDVANPGIIQRKLSAVTSEALGLLGAGGALVFPLIKWGDVTRQKVADLLVYELRSYEGLNADPQAASDQNVILRAQQAREALRQIGIENGTLTDPELVDSSADGSARGEIMMPESEEPRGW
jgi:hypothetical protein